MKVDLNQLGVLVTRPDPAGTELCHYIEASGGRAYHFPTLVIRPAPNLTALIQALQQLATYNWLIFVSPQAVYTATGLIRSIWPKLPSHLRIAAVGASTQSALKKAGFRRVICPLATWGSEGLLQLPEFQAVAQQNIAIVCGDGGREWLAQTLQTRGATVLSLVTYQHGLPDKPSPLYLNLLQQDKITVSVCASFRAVLHLKELLGEAAWPYLQNRPLVVVSDRIKKLASDLGFQTIWVARNASHEEILKTLADVRRSFLI